MFQYLFVHFDGIHNQINNIKVLHEIHIVLYKQGSLRLHH